METTSIKIIKTFDEYAFYKPFGVFKEVKKIETDVNIFGRQISICISSEELKQYIWFGIVDDIFNTKKIKLESVNSDWDFLVKIINKNNYENYTIYFQNYLDRFFMMVSSSKRSKESQSLAEDMYGDDILHIYGLWEVELSEELIRKLYTEN